MSPNCPFKLMYVSLYLKYYAKHLLLLRVTYNNFKAAEQTFLTILTRLLNAESCLACKI